MELRLSLLLVPVLAAGVAGCGGSAPSASLTRGDCPAAPLDVVVTLSQWSDIVGRLSGDCAHTTTIVSSTSADPHDYEPSPADAASFASADLVVENGLDYDAWAAKAVDAFSTRPAVLDAAEVAGVSAGANPHLWYSPRAVFALARAATAELKRLLPGAEAYLTRRHREWLRSMRPYREAIAALASAKRGTTYAATENVFDDMARALGLVDVTPEGYHNAAANESEPGPADIDAFDRALTGGQVRVLIDNVQTEGAVPDQLGETAVRAGVPVVEITENLPEGRSFAQWQVGQLSQLTAALAS